MGEEYMPISYEQQCKLDNPFYHNYLFSKEDLKTTTIKWYQYLVLWFLPMKVQITTDGVAYFKVWNGAYYFIDIKPL